MDGLPVDRGSIPRLAATERNQQVLVASNVSVRGHGDDVILRYAAPRFDPSRLYHLGLCLCGADVRGRDGAGISNDGTRLGLHDRHCFVADWRPVCGSWGDWRVRWPYFRGCEKPTGVPDQ